MSHISKNIRIFFLILSIILAIIIHKILTNSWSPTDSKTTFIFQNLILMIILGSTLIEDKFTKPVDALINSFMVLIALISVRKPIYYIAWNGNMLYAGIVFLFSIISIILGSEEDSVNTARNRIARFSYHISTFFGRANLIFSITFLLAIFSFFSSQQVDFLVLICFWAFIIIAQPIGLLSLFQNIFSLFEKKKIIECGKIISVTVPGILKYEPINDINVQVGNFIVFKQAQNRLAVVIDRFRLNDKNIAQAILLESIPKIPFKETSLQYNKLYHIGTIDDLKRILDKNNTIITKLQRFVGIIIENSSIGEITFRIASDINVEEGNILEAEVDGHQVLFQIVNAKTDTEVLLPEVKVGLVKGIAQQVGIWNKEKVRFDKYGWVPPIHTPLFLIDKTLRVDCEIKPNEFILGYIPNTNFPIIANVDTLITHHTAILGITGSGKTELAFTIIQKMIDLKTKVFCVDFTGDYIDEFKNFKPQILSLSSENAQELNDKLLEAETGQYGAGKEIKALEQFKSVLITEIMTMVSSFISSENYLGILELSEIANTSATIAITELYLSQIFSYARNHRASKQKFCVVLEEAHTIIPESQTMGAQDKFSKATISKICQIALQGRKYNVGLLVIAQRTANVTKTVLNQCNSVIVFNSYDKTGFDFLENYVGPGMISAIPNLKWLQSLVVGRGFKSGRPIIMEIPQKPKFSEKNQ
jgi:hypothetical protein